MKFNKNLITIIVLILSIATFLGSCEFIAGPDNGSGSNPGESNPFENGFALGLVPEPDITSSDFEGYFVVNENVPFFTEEDFARAADGCFEEYSDLDSLGRVGVAFACVCGKTLPPEGDKRGDIGHIKPTGWHQSTSYSGLNHLYDRSHLIAWSLSDEDDNAKNLVTGTVYMNQITMQIFENMVLNYMKSNKSTNKVLYRVTPVFNDDNLLCSGVLMEAYSLDDGGEDIEFCVFVYNVQKGIHLDYATGKNRLATSSDSSYYGSGAGFGAGVTEGGNTSNDGGNTDSEDSNDKAEFTFVLNTSTKKIHNPSCGSVTSMSDKNKQEWSGTYAELQELIGSGYTTCGTCKPAVE